MAVLRVGLVVLVLRRRRILDICHKTELTFAGIDGLLGDLALLDLGVGLYRELVLDLLVGIRHFRLLLVLLGQPKGSRPRQFLYVFNTVVLAAQHSRVGGRCADADLLALVDHVKTAHDLLVAFESA